jgi:4-amino-4-deoxy-L-arabinose transferase-like glycosyltransferase
VPLLVLMVAPWLVAIELATHGAFLRESVGHDFAGKVAGAQESHGAWPGTYLLLLPASFWPGSLFLGSAVAAAWGRWREPAMRFLVAWVVPFWLVLEVVPTKLPHYPLPAYPALALAVGYALVKSPGERWRWLQGIVGAGWLIVALGLAACLVAAPMRLGAGLSPAAIAIALILVVAGAAIFARAWTRPSPGPAWGAVILSVLVIAPILGIVLPSVDRIWLSRDAARMIAAHEPPSGVPIASVGYNEPSLVFMLGTATRLASPDQAAQAMTATRGAVALVEGRDDAAFRAALAKRGWAPRKIDAVGGIDYSNGRSMVLTLYAGEPG